MINENPPISGYESSAFFDKSLEEEAKSYEANFLLTAEPSIIKKFIPSKFRIQALKWAQ